ncbi:MAG: hypothetical protein QXQ46_04330 [Thermoplasmatales archaeon]
MLGIFGKIQEENIPTIKKNIESYVLQIDGATDADFSTIVVVRDAISGFTLFSKRCDSESDTSMNDLMEDIKERFGEPAGITCDMSQGIISAAQDVFPKAPIRISHMHFLRDLGKDIVMNMHTDLGLLINDAKIKRKLKRILKELPGYDRSTLVEIADGFCTDTEKAELMVIRKTLEGIIFVDKNSGYDFPFYLRYLNFFIGWEEGKAKLTELLTRVEYLEKYITTIMKHLSKIAENEEIKEITGKLRDVNSMVFLKIRETYPMTNAIRSKMILLLMRTAPSYLAS